MRTLRNSKYYLIVLSLVCIVFGVVLVLIPDFSLQTICYILGILAIVYGLVNIISYFSPQKEIFFNSYELVNALGGVGGGTFIILRSSLIIDILPSLMGVLLLLDAAMQFQHSMDLKRTESRLWGILLGMACLLGLLGGAMIVQPFGLSDIIVLYLGICLIVVGIVHIWSDRSIAHAIHIIELKQKRAQEQNQENKQELEAVNPKN